MKSYSENALKILDIALNLSRIANWTADSYEKKKDLIGYFVRQTQVYINDLDNLVFSNDMQSVLLRFRSEFVHLQQETITHANKDQWAEKALTWANILQHRAKLA